ncbi:MAG: hypothetical protein H6619_01055 [Deltaproteobacteria bacterium]|nr:hypothetical protein [Deltaproteobacteria bacterium]
MFACCITLGAGVSSACDLCAVYNSIEAQGVSADSFFIGATHQYTSFGSPALLPGREILGKQHLESFTTQIYSGYRFTDRFGVQVNLPLIERKFRRISDNVIETGSESGLGDISLLFKYTPAQIYSSESSFFYEFFGGFKLPSGDSDRLAEEQDEAEERSIFRHGSVDGNFVAGDDLALGSGSLDYILGASFFGQYRFISYSGSLQGSIRTEGDYDYQYGNDLQFNLAAGYFYAPSEDSTVDLRLRFSGEIKSKDQINGSDIEGSDDTVLYLGPQLSFSNSGLWYGSLGIDFPIKKDDSSEELTPDYRVQFTLSRRFRS